MRSNQNFLYMKLKIREFTTSASGWCLFGSKKEAVEMFDCLGLKGKTLLCNAVTPDGQIYTLWINKGETGVSFLPVFNLDLNEFDLRNVVLKPVSETMLLYQKNKNGSGIGFIAVFMEDDIVIRIMKIIPDENIMAAYCMFQGIEPEEIRLCRICTVQNDIYITACWSVRYEDPNELGPDGEPVVCETFLPVDFTDADKLHEFDFSSLNDLTIKEKEYFKVQDQIYQLRRDEKGKLFITKDFFGPRQYREREREPEEKTEAEKKNKKCKIIPLRQH